MNHTHLALVSPEPETSHLHQIGSKIRLGDIFTLNAALKYEPAKLDSGNVFRDARDIADNNKGTPVVFAGTFPDGKDRAQATLSLAPGQNVQEHKEKLATIFNAPVDDVVTNHYTKIEQDENGAERSRGHYYLSLTAEL